MEQSTMFKISFIVGIVAFFVLYRLLNKQDKQIQKELNEIVNKDEYKVKGQYE